MTARTVVVEDDARYRASLEVLFAHAPGFTLAASFGSAQLALAAASDARFGAESAWDLALMDIELPGINGIEAVRRLKEKLPELKVVMLTVFEEPRTVLSAICAGADGYLLKNTPPPELLEQLAVVMAGGAPLTAGVARTVLDLVRSGPAPAETAPQAAPRRLNLTEREQEVLRGLVRGMAYKEVAARLGVTLDTVRSHVKAVYRKLQVHSVAEAVGRAIHERLV